MFDIKNPSQLNEEDLKEKIDFEKYIVKTDEINKNVQNFFDGKLKKGYKIGIPCFDNHFVCKEKSLYALTGKKGKGKTTINKLIQLMQSIVNGLVWVVAFQENSDWGSKLEYLQYLLGDFASDVKKKNPELYKKASEWIDKHFIFLDVETIEIAIKTTEYLIGKGVKVHALLLDPVNSFEFGYVDSGNIYSDGVFSSKKVLRWCRKNVSIYVSQHPTIKAQREKNVVTPFDAEFGFWNNKAHFTWTINRTDISDENVIGVFNVREKLTGGHPTNEDEPLIIDWFPTKINIKKGNEVYENTIQYLVRKHNPLKYEYDYLPETKEIIPNSNLSEAFEIEPTVNDPNDLPF